MNYYSSPLTFQRGSGLGGILSRFFRTIVPIFKSRAVKTGVKRLGSAIVRTGASTLQDKIRRGTSLREGLHKHASKEVNSILAPPALKRRKTVSKPKKPRVVRRLDIFSKK